ncbi:MAG: thermonuclease family protein [Salinisphaeraceae bacterium]
MIKSTIVALLVVLAFGASADTLNGEVGKIFDGDTFVLDQGRSDEGIHIRLFGIDAPESSQAYGEQATEALKQAIDNREVVVEVTDRDQYGRSIGEVFVNGGSVNLWMVQAGHAWVYRRYNEDPRYLSAQRQAQNNQWGLWRLPSDQRQPPWQYRRSGQ